MLDMKRIRGGASRMTRHRAKHRDTSAGLSKRRTRRAKETPLCQSALKLRRRRMAIPSNANAASAGGAAISKTRGAWGHTNPIPSIHKYWHRGVTAAPVQKQAKRLPFTNQPWAQNRQPRASACTAQLSKNRFRQPLPTSSHVISPSSPLWPNDPSPPYNSR